MPDLRPQTNEELYDLLGETEKCKQESYEPHYEEKNANQFDHRRLLSS
jgi:hypothetical protein